MPCHVGAVLPKMAPSGVTWFQLCHNGECIPGGQLDTFGIDSPQSVDLRVVGQHKVNSTTHYVAESEVTNLLIDQGWFPSLEEPLVARFLEGVLENVPQPCVIIKTLNNNGAFVHVDVTLHPNEKQSNYGDLITTYGEAGIKVASVELPPFNLTMPIS